MPQGKRRPATETSPAPHARVDHLALAARPLRWWRPARVQAPPEACPARTPHRKGRHPPGPSRGMPASTANPEGRTTCLAAITACTGHNHDCAGGHGKPCQHTYRIRRHPAEGVFARPTPEPAHSAKRLGIDHCMTARPAAPGRNAGWPGAAHRAANPGTRPCPWRLATVHCPETPPRLGRCRGMRQHTRARSAGPAPGRSPTSAEAPAGRPRRQQASTRPHTTGPGRPAARPRHRRPHTLRTAWQSPGTARPAAGPPAVR